MTDRYVTDKHGRRYRLPADDRRHVEQSGTELPDDVDKYCGPVWVGGICFIVLGCAFAWCIIVAVFRWLAEVLS